MNETSERLIVEDLARLATAVNSGRWYTMRGEYAFYHDAIIAADEPAFQVWGIDLTTGERYPVMGEVGYEWLEVHEVAIHFNSDMDGNFYYVARPDAYMQVRPPTNEVTRRMVESQQESDHYGDYPPSYHMGYSDKLALHLLFETRPTANQPPYV